MNTKPTPANTPLCQAARAIVEDNRRLARKAIQSFLVDQRDHADALLIQAWTSDSIEDAFDAIGRALEIEPDHKIALAGLTWLNGIREFADQQIETERLEAERLEAERLEAERLEAERLEAERLEAERLEAERLEAERLEAERLEAERLEAERLEAERLEAEQRLEAERLEAERLEAERLEAERLEAEQRLEAERLEAERLEAERLEESTFENADDSEAKALHDMQQDVETLASDVHQEVQFDETVNQNPDPPSGKRPVVLAVDDSPTVRKLVSLTLEEQGFDVLVAADGIEALNILASRLPDIILSDINMPRLNGYKLCRFVKKHERTASIPVVMLSGKDGVFDKMRGKLSGCDDFIAKPFEAADLVAKVIEHLSSTAQ